MSSYNSKHVLCIIDLLSEWLGSERLSQPSRCKGSRACIVWL